MGWVQRLVEGLKNVVFGLSPVKLVAIAVLFILALVAMIVPIVTGFANAYYAYLVLGGLTIALFITRTIEPWEWGIEVYHLITFSVAFVFGPLVALAMNGVSFLFFPITQAMGRDWLHYMTKTLMGPAIQVIILGISAVFAGLLGIYAREAVMRDLPFYYLLSIIISDTTVGSVLRKMFTPLNETRMGIYAVIGLTFNYFLITKFGVGFIGFLEGLK